MVGSIYCAKCEKVIQSPCGCKFGKVYIRLNWNNKREKFYRDKAGDLFSYDDAFAQLYAMNIEIKKGIFKIDNWKYETVKSMLFENQVESWLEEKRLEVEHEELAHETYRVYESYNRNHWQDFFGKYDVRDIKYAQIKEFARFKMEGKSKKMKRNILHALNTFFVWLKKNELIKEMPEFEVIKGNDAKPRKALDYTSQRTAIGLIPLEYRDVVEFAFETGVRVGELCALKVFDINPDIPGLVVRRTYSGHRIKNNTKTNENRLIPLSDKAFFIAQRNMKDKTPEQWLFINPSTNRGYMPDYISKKIWRKYTDIPLTFYEASRHSFCTQLLENGVDLKTVQLLMGHRELRSTEAYTHIAIQKLLPYVNKRGKELKNLQDQYRKLTGKEYGWLR